VPCARHRAWLEEESTAREMRASVIGRRDRQEPSRNKATSLCYCDTNLSREMTSCKSRMGKTRESALGSPVPDFLSSCIEQTIQEYKSSMSFWVGAGAVGMKICSGRSGSTEDCRDGRWKMGGRGCRLVAGRPGVRDIVEGAGDDLFRVISWCHCLVLPDPNFFI